MNNCLKICSINVRGLADAVKRIDLFNWLKKKQFSIYCLQDVHICQKNQKKFREDWGSEILFSGISSESRGVAIMFGQNIDYKIKETFKDDKGNLLIVDVEICGQLFIIATLYGPNTDDPYFYIKLQEHIITKDNAPTILCGDRNMVMNFDQDTYSYLRENNIKAKKAVQNMINSFDLIDTWRVSHPDQNKYSWVS